MSDTAVTDSHTPDRSPPDGRAARRDRNRAAVLDAVITLFSEGTLDPGPEEVARRAGLSLRSVYRYFDDRQALLQAAIDRQTDAVRPLLAIHAIGAGPLADRIETLVTARLRLYEATAATSRAARSRAGSNPTLGRQVALARRTLRDQVDRQFASELAALDPRRRRSLEAAADALLQFDTLDLYRLHRGLSVRATHQVLSDALHALLDRPPHPKEPQP